VTDREKWKEGFQNVMALYCILKEPGTLRVKRAELKQGQVKPEPLDFLIDVEIKATRALTDPYSEDMWENVLDDPNSYADLPLPIQHILGEAFLKGHLGPESDYKFLYFKVRNDQVRQKQFKPETVNE
jgi:hypothetical protein